MTLHTLAILWLVLLFLVSQIGWLRPKGSRWRDIAVGGAVFCSVFLTLLSLFIIFAGFLP